MLPFEEKFKDALIGFAAVCGGGWHGLVATDDCEWCLRGYCERGAGGAGKMGIRRTLLAALELPCLTLTRQSFGF